MELIHIDLRRVQELIEIGSVGDSNTRIFQESLFTAMYLCYMIGFRLCNTYMTY
jgi:hypothetical protein